MNTTEHYTAWAMHPPAIAAMNAEIQSMPADLLAARVEAAERRSSQARPALFDRIGRIAVVNIIGVITRRPSIYSMLFGGASSLDIADAVTAAADDKSIESVVLRIDSPGGEVDGVPVAAEAIRRAGSIKPVLAVGDGMIASAAYWLASQASRIITTHDSNQTGSIGVRAIVTDSSEAANKAGLRVVDFSTSPLKSAGAAGLPIGEEVADDISREVASWFRRFTGDIGRGRSGSHISMGKVATGRVWFGSEAVGLGLIDEIKPLAAVLGEIRGASASRRIDAAYNPTSGSRSRSTLARLRLALAEAPEPLHAASSHTRATLARLAIAEREVV